MAASRLRRYARLDRNARDAVRARRHRAASRRACCAALGRSVVSSARGWPRVRRLPAGATSPSDSTADGATVSRALALSGVTPDYLDADGDQRFCRDATSRRETTDIRARRDHLGSRRAAAFPGPERDSGTPCDSRRQRSHPPASLVSRATRRCSACGATASRSSTRRSRKRARGRSSASRSACPMVRVLTRRSHGGDRGGVARRAPAESLDDAERGSRVDVHGATDGIDRDAVRSARAAACGDRDLRRRRVQRGPAHERDRRAYGVRRASVRTFSGSALRSSLALVGAAVGIGGPLAFMAGRALEAQLFGVAMRDDPAAPAARVRRARRGRARSRRPCRRVAQRASIPWSRCARTEPGLQRGPGIATCTLEKPGRGLCGSWNGDRAERSGCRDSSSPLAARRSLQ